MSAPSGIQVDILPFGAVDIDTGIEFKGQGLTTMHENGFMEVYQSGTQEIRVETGHNFKVATLPSIVLLKFIAFDDRPEHRTKDATDVANIIFHFFDLQAELIYREYASLFEEEERTLEEISAIVIGKEMKKICASNEKLLNRVSHILKTHIEQKEKSAFVRNMLTSPEATIEGKIKLLQNMYVSFVSG
jgi:predicted nucleotidyltransferase